MGGEKSQFTSDRRVPSTSSWTDNGDWAAGVAEGVDVVDGGLIGRPPNQHSGLPDRVVLHLNASDVTANDEDTLTTWSDSSGNGNDVTGHATYRTGISAANNNPVVRFNGGSDYFSRATSLFSQPVTVIAALRANTDTSKATVFTTEGDGSNRCHWSIENGEWEVFAGDNEQGGSAATYEWVIGTYVLDGRDSVVRTNGSESFTGFTPGNHSWNGFRVGEHYFDNANMSGDYGELLFVDGKLSSTQIDEQEQRLATKYGVNLP